MRAAATILAGLGAAVGIVLGIVLVIVQAADEVIGDEGSDVLSTQRAVLWFLLAGVAGAAAVLVRREPRRAAVVLAVVAVAGIVACGAWWLVVAPFVGLAAALAWAGRSGARTRTPASR